MSVADDGDILVPLAARVFRTIAMRLCCKATELSRFAATMYSFEEWLNWEAFAACTADTLWQVRPKPSYSIQGVHQCKDYGDLLVSEGETKVLVEIGLVHDGTGNKWPAKLARDVVKLTRPMVGVQPLHMILLTSITDIDASQAWQRWLLKVECWSRPTDLTCNFNLPPNGKMILKGWTQ